MATPYSDIFSSFTRKITDYNMGELADDIIEEDNIGLLNSAVVYFRLPKVSLAHSDAMEIFEENLSYEEIEIIATLMVREWFKRLIYNTDTLEQKFGDSDFSFKSQASHLRALAEGYKSTIDASIKKLLSNYSRSYKGEIFNYRRLAGKKK